MGEWFDGYSQYSDDELIDRLRRGETSVMDYICDKYKNLVRSKAKSMFILGADSEDLIQEGMIGLFKAVRDYDMGRDASFSTFAELCVNRQIYTAVDGETAGDDRDGLRLAELLTDRPELNPEELFLDKERVAYLEKTIEEELSDFENQVLDLYITGMSYTQIAKVLGRDEKATDNALQRLKAKIKKML